MYEEIKKKMNDLERVKEEITKNTNQSLYKKISDLQKEIGEVKLIHEKKVSELLEDNAELK